MSIKITCPKKSCQSKQSVPQPLPLPGSTIQCIECGQKISMTYPEGAIDKLRAKGIAFEGDEPAAEPPKAPNVHSPSKTASKTKPTPVSSSSAQNIKERSTLIDERPKTKSTRQKKSAPSHQTSAPSASNVANEDSPSTKSKTRSWLKWIAGGIGLSGLLGTAVIAGTFYHFQQEVPSVEELRDYEPPTVTTLFDRNGEVLAELYKNVDMSDNTKTSPNI